MDGHLAPIIGNNQPLPCLLPKCRPWIRYGNGNWYVECQRHKLWAIDYKTALDASRGWLRGDAVRYM